MRKRLTKFAIEEVSIVDRPAQRNAKTVIHKRADTRIGLIDALHVIHDDAPNAEKRVWANIINEAELNIAKQESGEIVDLEALSCSMLEAAKRRLEAMIAGVRDGAGMSAEDAHRAVENSRAGSLLTEILDLAERLNVATADINKAKENDVVSYHPNSQSEVFEALHKASRALATEACDELDRLAKARAATTGENFYTAYENVCEANAELAHRAVNGGPTHGVNPSVLPLSKSEFEFDGAVRRSEKVKEFDVRAADRSASDALLKRAKTIQLERARLGRSVDFIAALEIAKSERPNLAKSATFKN